MGFIWKRKTSFIVPQKVEVIKKRLTIKETCRFDLWGNFIDGFDGAITASKKTGIPHYSILSSCKKGFASSGYFWRYKEDLDEKNPKIEQKYIDAAHKPILEYTYDGQHFIKKQKTINEAVRDSNVKYDTIKKMCDGKNTHYKDSLFVYQTSLEIPSSIIPFYLQTKKSA